MSKAIKILAVDRLRMGLDGEGITTLVVLYHCPLRCKYCINDDCHSVPRNAYLLTAKQLVEKCMIDNLYYIYTNGGITIGGGEPLLQSDFIHEVKELMPTEWKLNIETSLNIPTENVKHIINDITSWFIDIKDMNPDIYKKYTQCSNDQVITNLNLISSLGLQNKCIIRIPLIPSFNTEDDRKKSIEALKEMGFTNFDLFEYICS